jgi:hypothetical protein
MSDDPDHLAQRHAMSPTGVGRPGDVASAAVFLALALP